MTDPASSILHSPVNQAASAIESVQAPISLAHRPRRLRCTDTLRRMEREPVLCVDETIVMEGEGWRGVALGQ